MRNKLVLSLVLLVSLAWAVAQQQSTSPSTPAPDTGQQTQSAPSTPSTPDQNRTPGAPSAGAMSPNGEPDVIEGCLGGTAPNFTVTDNTGKSYKLDIPAGADPSVLTKHVGESVQVMGAVNGGSSAGATDTKSGSSIAVQRIGRGKGTCSGSSTGTGEKPSTPPTTSTPPKQ